MNKLPLDRLPTRLPQTVVYIERDKDTTIENLKHLPVTTKDRAEAFEMLQLLYPGSHMIGLHSGHTKMVDGKVVPFSDK